MKKVILLIALSTMMFGKSLVDEMNYYVLENQKNWASNISITCVKDLAFLEVIKTHRGFTYPIWEGDKRVTCSELKKRSKRK